MQSSDPLADALAHYGDLVQAQIRRIVDAVTQPDDFYDMMRYHLGWRDEQLQPVAAPRGKGLRGALVMLVNDACGGAAAAAAPLAAAVELLHNFSLVHDDIEDGSATRRHRPTAWSLWGAPLTINMGDGIYALAHLALYHSPLRQAAPERFINIMHGFEQAALRLCEGQHLDMSFEHAATITGDDYLRMIGGKSATLIAAAAWMGACAAGAAEQRAQAAYRFGFELGMAFQMQDDILGIWGDEAVTGKSAVSDITSRKKTLPILLALEHASAGDRARLRALYTHSGGVAAETDEIMTILDGAKTRTRTQDQLQQYWDTAMAALEEMMLPPTAYERLHGVARLFVERVS